MDLGLGLRRDGRYSGSMVYIVRSPDAFALALGRGFKRNLNLAWDVI